MKPQALLNFWRHESLSLPPADTNGAWTVSPGGVYFITQLSRDELTGKWEIGWALCNANLEPLGITFRQTEVELA